MTLKDITLVVIFTVAWTHHACGISYSKVYVQNGGSDPVDFVKYGAPGVYTDAQIARLSAPPIGSVLPLPSVQNVIPPCVSPCVLPNGNIASALPVNTNAKLITYNAPSLPVVVAPSKDNGYEYSYVVYDENTGDQKAQRESSDGAVVRGEYSFIQPDGYVRQVQYTADDLKGFNAVVKKILPDSIGKGDKGKKKPEAKEKKEPCEPAKKEALKEKPEVVGGGYNENAQDIEVNIVKPSPTKAPEKKEPKAKDAVKPKPEPENPKTVLPLNKKEEGPKVNKDIAVAPTPPQIDSRGVVAYDDIIRCLQSKIQRPQGLYTSGVSPLTYIILPGGGPC